MFKRLGILVTLTLGMMAAALGQPNATLNNFAPLSPQLTYLQSGLPAVMPASGYINATGQFIIGANPAASATVSFSATSGAGVTVTFSAATLTGTAAGDTGRVVTVIDTTIKSCLITGNSGASTTIAQCTLNATLSGTGPFSNANTYLSGTNPAANTAGNGVTFPAPLQSIYAAAYLYFPTSSPLGTGTNSQMFYCVPISAATGTCYNNTLIPGAIYPTAPATPVAFSGLTANTYAQTTGSAIAILIGVIPAGAMGINGCLEIFNVHSYDQSGNNKIVSNRFAAASIPQPVTDTTGNANGTTRMISRMCNRANAAVNIMSSDYTAGTSSTTMTTSPLVTGTVNTAASQNGSLSVNLAAATDTVAFEEYWMRVVPSSP